MLLVKVQKISNFYPFNKVNAKLVESNINDIFINISFLIVSFRNIINLRFKINLINIKTKNKIK